MTLKSLLQRIQTQLSAPPTEKVHTRDEAIRIATAGVLLEIAHADDKLKPEEEAHLVQHLQQQFGLDDPTTRDLMELADTHRKQTIDHFGFTNFLRVETTLEQRIDIVKSMWRIVYADGSLSQNEDYLLRKLATLLGLEHHIMIEAKVAVRRELGIAT